MFKTKICDEILRYMGNYRLFLGFVKNSMFNSLTVISFKIFSIFLSILSYHNQSILFSHTSLRALLPLKNVCVSPQVFGCHGYASFVTGHLFSCLYLVASRLADRDLGWPLMTRQRPLVGQFWNETGRIATDRHSSSRCPSKGRSRDDCSEGGKKMTPSNSTYYCQSHVQLKWVHGVYYSWYSGTSL